MMKPRRLSVIIFFFLLLNLQLCSIAATVLGGGGIYLHLDNSSYLLGEDLRFSATVLRDSASEGIDSMLHIELLAPEGYVVESRVYGMNGGRCHGKIYLRPSLLSGLFEVRAYTSSMIEASPTNYYTAVVPVLDGSIPGNLSIYDRQRKGSSPGGVGKRPFGNMKGVSQGGIAIECDTIEVRSPCKLRLRLKGMPGSRLSLSVTDSCRSLGVGRRATIADFAAFGWMGHAASNATLTDDGGNADSDGESLDGAHPFFSPAPRAYSEEEEALASIPGVKIVAPLLPKTNTQVVGITHSAIHTTFDNEIRWAKAHGMERVDFRSEHSGLAFLYLLRSICSRYRFPFGSPYKVRIVSVKGDYSGDSLVPECLRIYDGGEFRMDDYGEVIIRTDSAICEAFSYSRHAPYYDMGRRGGSLSIGSRSAYPTGMPAMVICLVPKAVSGGTLTAFDANVGDGAKLLHQDGNGSYTAGQCYCGRVLYWNPDIVLDGNGEASAEFNCCDSCKGLSVSAEGIAPGGQPMVYRQIIEKNK